MRLGLVTSKGIAIASQGMGLFGLQPYFDVLVTLEDTTRHKPFPDPVLLACERLGIAPHEAVYVGDATWDIEAGKAAGARRRGLPGARAWKKSSLLPRPTGPSTI